MASRLGLCLLKNQNSQFSIPQPSQFHSLLLCCSCCSLDLASFSPSRLLLAAAPCLLLALGCCCSSASARPLLLLLARSCSSAVRCCSFSPSRLLQLQLQLQLQLHCSSLQSCKRTCQKVMDLKLFKLDIDELINEFTECESTSFAEFKRVWLSRKFSFIFEASPSTNQGFFMQSLYGHSIGYLVSAGSLKNRWGGLYCLYCLYETQPFKPPFKIYLSLGELRQLKNLALDAKRMGIKVVSALMKRMLEKNMFLFGFVGVNEGSATERVNELTDIQNARVQAAYKKCHCDSIGYLLILVWSTSSTWTWAWSLMLICSRKDHLIMLWPRSSPSKRLAKR